MLDLEKRRDFLDAKARGDWNACVEIAESISVQAEPVEAAAISLFTAEAVSLLSGMPGLCPTELLAAVKAAPEDEMLWDMFRQTAMDVRNIGILGHAYRMRIDWAKDDIQRAERTLEFGHYLRFLAAAHAEAVVAYQEVLRLDPSLETAAFVSLHQLYRDDPLCDAAKAAIAALCEKQGVSEEALKDLKARLTEIPAESRDERAKAMIALARMMFLLWGDIGHGMELAAAAFEASACVRDQAIILIRGLGLAMPDNMAVLDHCILNLEELGDWKNALALGKKLLDLSKNGTMRLRTALRLTKDATSVESADAEAAYFFQKAYSADPAGWLIEVERDDWILKYAFNSPLFAETLLSQLAQCGARKQFLDVRSALSSAGTSKRALQASQGAEPETENKKDPLHILPDSAEKKSKPALPQLPESRLKLPKLNDKGVVLPMLSVKKKSVAQIADQSWKPVVADVLKYVPYSLSWSAKCPMGVDALVEKLNTLDDAYPILLDALHEMIENQDFSMQVAMNDNQNQQMQYMAKLDEMIAMYASDTAKKNEFLEKKYQVASVLGDERAKLLCLKEIIDTDPTNSFAVDHVQSLDENTLKPHSQLLLCQLRIMLCKDSEQQYVLRNHLAELYGKTSQYNNAINLYRALIDEKPDLVEPRYCLIDLLIQLENWKSAENVMLSLVNIEPDPRRRFDGLVRLAKIQDEKMMMPSRALLTLFAAIDIIPDLPVLHDLLCQISERIHSYSPLIDKYEELARHSENREVRCQATARLARLYVDKLNQPSAAANILNDLYDHGGSDDLEFMRSMVPICYELELWNDYVRVLLRIVEISADKHEVVRSLLLVAQVYASDPMNHEQAIAFAKRASLMEPDNGDDWSVIADIMLIKNEYQDAMRALQKALKYQDGFDRARTLLKMAQINSELEDLVEATKLFHQAAQLGAPLEDLLPVVEHLIFLATMQHSQTAFETLCNDLIAASPEEERAELLLQQAMTLARVFDDLDSSRRIIEILAPHFAEFDVDQNCVLADIFSLLHEEQAAVDLNFKILRNNELSEKQRFQRLQAMLANATQLNDVNLIKNVCSAIIEHDPEDLNANFHLIELDYNAGRWDIAAKRIQKFISMADRLNAESAMHLYYYYADILHAAQHDNLALEHLNKALAIRSDYKAAVDLKLTIYLEHEHWQEALPSFKVLLSLSQDDDERGAIHKRIAEVWHFYLNDPDKAIQEYEQALTLGGDVEDVPIRLLELYRSQGLWQKAAITAQVLAQAQTSSEEARLEYLKILGDIWENHLDELTLAENTYQEMFESAPLREDVVASLVRVLMAQKKFEAFTRIAERLIVVSKREFEAGMSMFAVMFSLSCRNLHARPVLKSILVRLSEVFPGQRAVTSLAQYLDVPLENVVIESERSKRTSVQELPPVVPMQAPARPRKQTMPSMSTSLTIDSGVLNPNFDSGLMRRPVLDAGNSAGDSGFGRRPSTDSLHRADESGLGNRPSTDSLRRSGESGLGNRPTTDSMRRADESGLMGINRPQTGSLLRPDDSGVLGLRPKTGSLRRADESGISGLKKRPSTDSLRRADESGVSGLNKRPSTDSLRRAGESGVSGLKKRPSTDSLRRADESGISGLKKRPSTDSLRRADESGLGQRHITDSIKRANESSGLRSRPTTDSLHRKTDEKDAAYLSDVPASLFSQSDIQQATHDSGLLRPPSYSLNASKGLPSLVKATTATRTQKVVLPENSPSSQSVSEPQIPQSSEVTRRTRLDSIEPPAHVLEDLSSDTVRRRMDTLKKSQSSTSDANAPSLSRSSYDSLNELPLLSPSALMPVVAEDALPVLDADDVLIPVKK